MKKIKKDFVDFYLMVLDEEQRRQTQKEAYLAAEVRWLGEGNPTPRFSHWESFRGATWRYMKQGTPFFIALATVGSIDATIMKRARNYDEAKRWVLRLQAGIVTGPIEVKIYTSLTGRLDETADMIEILNPSI